MIKSVLLKISGGVDLSKGKTGIGVNSWGWWRIIFPYQKRFYQSARYHDIAFDRGGNDDDMHRANWMFYSMCMAVSETLLQKIVANTYLYMTETFGQYFFTYK